VIVDHHASSTTLTPESGGIAAAGTPSGAGIAHRPLLWMQDGDGVRVDIEAVGSLHNSIIEEPDTTVLE